MRVGNRIVVVGAGIVGVTCALELQRRGASVTLVDRKGPGLETSYGNAGVLATSSLMPFNNPSLYRNLPTLLKNRSQSFRYRPGYLARNLGWVSRFVANARRSQFSKTSAALHDLITVSTGEHVRLLKEAGASHRLRSTGWLFLYKDGAAFDKGGLARATYDRFGISYQVLDRNQLRELEPHLAPNFERAVWMDSTRSVDSPGQVVRSYFDLFLARGGKFVAADVASLAAGEAGHWQVRASGGLSLETDRMVVALGPWSDTFLGGIGLKVPMAYERGYHMHYTARNGAVLHRPVYDTSGGYVLTPMEQGIRLGSGVELTDRAAPPDYTQLNLSEATARRVFPLGDRLDERPWMGCRPTLPDSRPVIGEVLSKKGLWVAFGHQHIGFNTSAGTAVVLGALMFGDAPPIDATPFSPARYF